MATPTRINLIGFAVLGAVSLGLSAYALLRPGSAPMPPPVRDAGVGPAAPAPPSGGSIVVVPPPSPVVPALESLRAWASAGFDDGDKRLHDVARELRGHVPEALRHWAASRGDGHADEAMARAIVLALGDADRDAVIAGLTDAPWLATVLVERRWAVAARLVVRDRLADDGQRLPPFALDWALALAEAAAPADLPLLARILPRLASDGERATLAVRMRALPGCDWADAVRRAWGVRAAGAVGAGDGNRRWVRQAAEAGVEEAFLSLGGQGLDADWILAQPAVGGRMPDAAWFSAARGRLDFADGVWRLRAGAAPPATPARAPLPVAKPDPPIPPPPPGLSADADAATVSAWIEQQLAAVADQREISWKDPVVDRLAAVPPRHYAELIAAYGRRQHVGAAAYFLSCAIERAARTEHRELLVEHVAHCPGLAEYVVAHGWSAAAAPGLRRILAQRQSSHPFAVACAVEGLASLGDAGDREILREALVRSRFGYWQARMADALAVMPGFDLDAAVRAAWRARPRTDYGDQQEAFCLWAARIGRPDGLALVVAHASGGPVEWKSGSLAEASRAYIARTFQIDADAAAIAAWWSVARNAVRWDPAARAWLAPGPAVPRASATGGDF